ncbi:MAG TPA: LON peptidase substrate-binding domain-containing protein [Myxococcota bacterium]|jgi:Lon protease-like protein|nr:LON peptidase substrate-binding domain-containing protein [Myxococcota bacterium]
MLFPLSNVVLFPATVVPLHVFEERYRQMTSDALAGDRTIGMIAVHPRHVAEMPGDPPLFEVGCAGVIDRWEELPDGRYQFILAATHRFRIVRELPRGESRLYRVADVEALAEPFPPEDAPAVRSLRSAVIDRFGELAALAAPERSSEVSSALFDGVDDVRLLNTLCQLLDLATAEKQDLLEANGVRQRYERLHRLLDFRVAEQRSSTGAPGPLRH